MGPTVSLSPIRVGSSRRLVGSLRHPYPSRGEVSPRIYKCLKNAGIRGVTTLEDEARKLAVLFEEEERVLVAYLFGSYAMGLETPRSDVDIAVLLSEVPERPLEYYLRLERELAKVLERDVDLVFLNDAPPLLRYQVIKYGKLLFSRDERVRVMFEAKSLCEYLDFSRVLKRYDECFVKRILA